MSQIAISICEHLDPIFVVVCIVPKHGIVGKDVGKGTFSKVIQRLGQKTDSSCVFPADYMETRCNLYQQSLHNVQYLPPSGLAAC
jgi:hypothetical protein